MYKLYCVPTVHGLSWKSFNYDPKKARLICGSYIEDSSFQPQQKFLSYSNILASNVQNFSFLLRFWSFLSLGGQDTMHKHLNVICGLLVENSKLSFKQKFLTISKILGWKSDITANIIHTWRWLFQQRVVGKKYAFSTHRSKCWSYDQTVWDEKNRNKFLQAPNVGLHVWWTCGQHALTKSEKMVKKHWFLPEKSTFFDRFSLLVNACWPHVHHTCNPTLGAWRNLFGPFLPQTVWSYD